MPRARVPTPITSVEILLVEYNPKDVELTLHGLKKHKLTNQVHVARDGQEALDFFFDGDKVKAVRIGRRLREDVRRFPR